MKQITKKILIIIIYIGLIVINTKVYATTGITTEETTRIRREANTESEVIELISKDTEVEILEEEGDWYKVTYLEYTGYIRKDLITKKEQTSNSTEQNTVSENNESQESSTDQNTQSQENSISENNKTQESTADENTSNENSNASETEQTNLEIGKTCNLAEGIELKILPSITSTNIVKINEDAQITIIDTINKWAYIQTENDSGWVLFSKIKPKEEKSQNQDETNSEEEEKKEEETKTQQTDTQTSSEEKVVTKYVSAETLNVRESTNNDAKVINQLKLNTKVTVVEVVNSTWSKIKAEDITGYVASKYLSDSKVETSSRSEDLSREEEQTEQQTTNTSKQETSETKNEEQSNTQTSSSNSSSLNQEIVAYAKQYLGYKYVSGGTAPSTGFDCSGFTYYVYKHFGITLNRTSKAQASNGTAVSKENIQPGDLLIFNNSSNSAIGHVGIYLGNNLFIHAANASKGVITTSTTSSYYQSRFVAARRIVN